MRAVGSLEMFDYSSFLVIDLMLLPALLLFMNLVGTPAFCAITLVVSH